jgi:DNA polymerase-3 subunit gamma/tau
MAALYRKYRPQTFDEVIGQEPVARTLKNAIGHDQVRQAYLFAGPRGTGKTSMARILAKSLNCVNGPTIEPCGICESCVSIAAGSSLDVIEMDAASQRGIDDIREIRDRVVLQPAGGQNARKVYILDEAHQLTDAAWNALLKLIEEPPPHLVFVFCTTDLSKVLATVRSRCQTFQFQRPRLPDLLRYLKWITEGEQIDAPDQALALVARAARGAFRDAGSTLDQLAAATEGTITVQDVLQLLGGVEEDALFRICDLVLDRDTAGALSFVEELAEQGQDLGRVVTDLLEHLRQLLLVQHIGEVPETLPLTEEARERLRAQANQLGEPVVLRLCDLLAVAVEDMRQGGDPRLPLELALVKVTRPSADLSGESLAFRLEQLEQQRSHVVAVATQPVELQAPPAPQPSEPPSAAAEPPALELEQLRHAWSRSVLEAVRRRSIPIAAALGEGRPSELVGSTLTVEFPPNAAFHLTLAEDPKNQAILREALYEITGRKLALEYALGESTREEPPETEPQITSEEDFVSLLKDTFDAREVDN